MFENLTTFPCNPSKFFSGHKRAINTRKKLQEYDVEGTGAGELLLDMAVCFDFRGRAGFDGICGSRVQSGLLLSSLL